MADLIAFLAEQIDTDERAALFVTSDYAEHDAEWTEPSSGVLQIGDELIPTGDSPVSRFMAEFDPARALRQVTVFRSILDDHKGMRDGLERDGHPLYCGECGPTFGPNHKVVFPCDTVVLLAAIYSDRPGYRAEWTPEWTV